MLHWLWKCAGVDAARDEDTLEKRDSVAWHLSLGAHLIVIVSLSILATHQPAPPMVVELLFTPDEDVEELSLEPFELIEPTESGDMAMPDNTLAEHFDKLAETVELDEAAAEFPASETTVATIDVEPNVAAIEGKSLMKRVSVSGVTGAGAGSVGGAVDRLTEEILASLEQRPTLVVWLLDASPSMRPKREQIAKRFTNIYQQLDASRMHGHAGFKHSKSKALLSSVVSFGQQMPKFETQQPTDDFEQLSAAVANIVDDPSGIESTFRALKVAGETFSRHRQLGRNVMYIVATDEAGDDARLSDEVIALLARYQMPVYVIGSPAPFGRERVPVRFHIPGNDQYAAGTYWVSVRLGPASQAREVVQLPFWQTKRGIDPLLIDSGFGPFDLSRLCHETGGIYFSVHPGKQGMPSDDESVLARFDQFFNPRVMRRYAPDYISRDEYFAKLRSNKARAALVQAAEMARIANARPPKYRFPVPNQAALNTALKEGQKSAARLEPRLVQFYDLLKLGEADRAKLVAPRWQAGYDLAMGRVCAAKVRLEGYNAILAGLKRGEFKFEKADSDTWDLHASDEILTGSRMAKLAASARTYLQRVIDDHPGTPWAFQAQLELETPLGWEWREAHTGAGQTRPPQTGTPAPRVGDQVKEIPRKPRPPVPDEI